MESYLTGRGDSSGDALPSSEEEGFRSYLDDDPKQVISPADTDGKENEQVEVVYDEANCPKVEVVSSEGKPRRIVIHLPDGKLLEISCEY
jgi:hypothetical protein